MKRLCVLLLLLFSAFPASASERILALAPHVCEMLFAIGAGDEVVGAVSYCDYPAAAKKLPRVGTYNRINIEAAIALRPTVAIVTDAATPGVKKLSALGVRIVRSHPEKVEEVLADIRRLGEITGHKQQADQVAFALQQRLDVLPARTNQKKLRVFYEIWPDPLLTAGKNTFIHDVLKHLGLVNVFGAVQMEAPRVNVESVLAAKPQLVIVPSEKRDVSVRSQYWKKWLGEDIQVITVNPDLLHRSGPRLLDGMEALDVQLQGLNFEK